MTIYNRDVSRISSEGATPPGDMPTWREAMTSVATVYEVGEVSSNVDAHGVWPGGSPPTTLYAGPDTSLGTAFRVHKGYGSSVFASDVGDWGTMIFGGTGENQFNSPLTKFNLSLDAPTWEVHQQPLYFLTAATAAAAGASCYNNATDAAAIASNHYLQETNPTFNANWDGTFPIKMFENWVIPAKITGGLITQGNSMPHSFRYGAPTYIPASVTGTGTGHITTTDRAFHGPFAQGPAPRDDNIPSTRLFADLDAVGNGSDKVKRHIYVHNVETGAWKKVTAQIPDYAGAILTEEPFSFCDYATNRVYYMTTLGGDFALMYVNFSGLSWANIQNATITGPTALTHVSGSIGSSQSTNHIFTNGHPTGKKLMFMKSGGGAQRLQMIDVDTMSIYGLLISSLPTASWWGFGYDAIRNRLIITIHNITEILCYWAEIPSVPTVAANWSFTQVTISLGGVTLDPDAGPWNYGQRNQFIPGLECILITQGYSTKMLAYRPY